MTFSFIHHESPETPTTRLHSFAVAGLLCLLIGGFYLTAIIVRRSMTEVALSSNSVMASHLAEEGIELVRAVRDTNSNNGQAWDAGLVDGDYLASYLPLASGGVLCRVGRSECPTITPLYQNAASGFYAYPGDNFSGTASRFTRVVRLQPKDDASARTYLLLTRNVSWGSEPHEQVRVAAHFYDWRVSK